VHYAGAKIDEKINRIVTASGRVLYVTGIGVNIDQAAAHAYAAIGQTNDKIGFTGMQHRNDIGYQARKSVNVN
jgi:phosphoribosylamine-glycine ligase